MSRIALAFPSSVSPPSREPATDARGREVAAQFEGLLFAQALAPLATSCGFLGDEIARLVATDVARRDGGPLGATLERAIESARRDQTVPE